MIAQHTLALMRANGRPEARVSAAGSAAARNPTRSQAISRNFLAAQAMIGTKTR